MFNGYCFDIEANGLYFQADTIWVVSLRDLDNPEKTMTLNPFKDDNAFTKWEEWHNNYENPMIIGHYILGYDSFVCFKLLGIPFTVGKDTMFGEPCRFVDTLYLSQYLNPDLNGHSLGDWGERVGVSKIDYHAVAKERGIIPASAKKGDEFMVYNELMDTYCERDTEVNVKAFYKMWDRFSHYYSCTPDEIPAHFKCGQKAHYLMSCQEFTGWKFDVELGLKLQAKIQGMMQEIENEVLPKLPPRGLKKGEQKEYTMPAKPFKKDGTFSSHMVNFIEKHGGVVLDSGKVSFYGKEYDVVGGTMLNVEVKMEIKDSDDLKEWFIASGWIPTLYNFKRGPDGKPERDSKGQLIKTSPKIQEAGKLCPNLEKLDGDLPKQIVKFLSLRNRLSVLTSWLENPRLKMDGRLSPRRTGIAATHRQKHAEIVNVPKASDKVLLGKEFRSLFIAEEGMMIAAGDAAALEGRVQGHYVWRYDGGETAKELLSGDPHSKNAFAFYGDILTDKGFSLGSPDFDKENPEFKPFRDKSKSGYYCLPLKTKVLTSDGWKFYNELSVGDKLPTFNNETGCVEDDVILAVHEFKDTEVFRYSNSRDSFECTDNHRWYGWKRLKSKAGSRSSYGYFESCEITQEHSILMTAPYRKSGGSSVTPDEAKLMGYILSDGSYRWSDISSGPSCSFGARRGVSITIVQSVGKFHEEVEQLLNKLGLGYRKFKKEVENGNTVFTWKISQPDSRLFLDRVVGERANKHDTDWTKWVMGLGVAALSSFYDGFYSGDGDVLGDREVVTQNKGSIHEAVVAAAQLLGRGRLSINHRNCGKVCNTRVQKNRHITMQRVRKESIGTMDTFCLTTGNGSFIIWQDDFVSITGNCIMYGGGGPKVAATLGLPETKGKELMDKFWNANGGTKALKDNLERFWETKGEKKWLPAIDGRRLITRKKSALLNTIFQSCGGIAMDYACCFMDLWLGGIKFDKSFKPYYKYKGHTVRRIGYYHDEVEFECDEDIAPEIAKMIEKAIQKAGEHLKLNIPLEGEGKYGLNWKEVH